MTKVIAEIGINHDGSYEIAENLINSAKTSGAWGVKFQYRNIENSYHKNSNEIGDASLKDEIKRAYISPKSILKLCEVARNLNLKVGISFFVRQDINDFGNSISVFDFFKVPSVEMSNLELLSSLLKLNKEVLISTGCHSEKEIIKITKFLKRFENNWTMFHCVSNYPVIGFNAKLGYIDWLKNLTKKNVGYSSHDTNWEICLLAAQKGVSYIERHLTLDKYSNGLDHSTSSTPDELKKLCKILNDLDIINEGNKPRELNQGELLNKQNLGRCAVVGEDFEIGQVVDDKKINFFSPNIGLDYNSFEDYSSRKLIKKIKKGEVLLKSHYQKKIKLTDNEIDFCVEKNISLPVRLHDLKDIEKEIPIKNFEFHLSYKELDNGLNKSILNKNCKYTIHLPDYINPTQLINPFSSDRTQKIRSNDLLEKSFKMAHQISDYTKKPVLIVGSLSVVDNDQKTFYFDVKNLSNRAKKEGIDFVPQWLPPIAWYFGGSVELDVFCNDQAVTFINDFNIPICLDVSHLFMCRSKLKPNFEAIFKDLLSKSKHIHIADSSGIDGEGFEIGSGDQMNLSYIKKAIDYKDQKVIEVWQGHLDNYFGFRKAIRSIYNLSK